MKTHLNLLPITLQRRLHLRRQSRQWALRGALLAALAFALLGGSLHQLTSARAQLELWQRRAAGIEAIGESNDELARKIRLIQRRIDKYRDVKSDSLGFQVLATVSRSAQGTAGEMQIQKMSLTQVAVAPSPAASPGAKDGKAPAKAAPERISYRLSLLGIARDNLQVAQFASALRDSGAFEHVDLKSSRGNKEPHEDYRTYQIDCAF